MEKPYQILFLNMPFGGIDRPALGVSSLKSNIEKRDSTVILLILMSNLHIVLVLKCMKL